MNNRIFGKNVFSKRNCSAKGAIPLLRFWGKSVAIFILSLLVTGCAAKDDNLIPIDANFVEEPVENGVSVTNSTIVNPESYSSPIIEQADDTEGICFVFVCGAVNSPGVYEFKGNDHVVAAIDAAGGFREDADINYLNLAEKISDGMRIYVPVSGEEIKPEMSADKSLSSSEKSDTGSCPVNINTADASMLMTLPGIGKSKAEKIINYREKNGGFGSISDIMNVDGIKNGMYDKIKDFITVN